MSQPESDDLLYYLYAVVRPLRASAGPLPAEGIVPGAAPLLIHSGELGAVVSLVPAALFSAAALEHNLRDADWARERVLAHQATLVALLADYAALPCPLCTLFRSRASIERLLASSAARFAAGLDQVAGATEWGVKLFSERKAAATWAAEAADAFAPLRAAIAAATPGKRYLLQRQLAQSAERQTEAAQATLAAAVHAALAPLARAAATATPQPPQVHGRSADMILSGVYLVDDTAQGQFAAQLDALRQQHRQHGLELELTGPWPPYSFATLRATEEPT